MHYIVNKKQNALAFFKHQNTIRWILIISSFIIVLLILWNTYSFFQNFKEEERTKIEIWSSAQEEFVKSDDNPNIDLFLKILNSNKTTPIIAINNIGEVGSYSNLPDVRMDDSLYVNSLISQFKSQNKPIEILVNNDVYQTIYYGNSPILTKLKYYPLALLLIIFLFGAVVYFFYSSNKNAMQNKLWTGMAKETAHQIGTPLSSLVGWAEILKSENVNPEYILEIEKDTARLQTITDRFSKIGSIPKLEKADIVKETIASFDYLKARSSKLINFELVAPETQHFVNLNSQLYSWTIENLVKNGIDAMRGKGDLKLEIIPTSKEVKIRVTDSGKGLARSQYYAVFEPGFTTKKRGWGLGLSLAKRIIGDYHDGQIKVLSSEVGKGTTMQITLKLV